METPQQSSDLFAQQREPVNYGNLKVLSVLTFIGCGLSYIGLCWNALQWGNYEQQLADIEKAQEKMGDSGMGKLFQGSIEIVQKSHEYRYILFATGLVFTTFCLVGALQMRKLKKSGYPLYVFGELAPLIVSGALLGFNFFAGISIAISAIVALVFVILYSTQRKHLVY